MHCTKAQHAHTQKKITFNGENESVFHARNKQINQKFQ